MATEDKTAVAIVFERVNQRGVELDTVQLLSAWTWSGDFDLNQKFEDLAEELAPFGFRDVGGNKDLLLRCCAAVLARDPSPEALISLNGSKVRSSFDLVVTGIKGAIDFLRRNLHAESLDNLPYDNLLVPLSVFFSGLASTQQRVTHAQRKEILKWFWRTALGRRYNSQPIKSLREDVAEFWQMKEGRTTTLSINKTALFIGKEFFIKNVFRLNSVVSRAFILMLAQNHPLSFISGNKIDLRRVLKIYNRNEFHYIYPRNYLRTSGQDKNEDKSCFANICFMSRSDNNAISGAAPSIYRTKLPDNISEIERGNFLPPSTFRDNYKQFVAERATLLAKFASNLVTPGV